MVRTGLVRLLSERLDAIRGARIGLMCHGASVDSDLRYAFDLLRSAHVDIRFILAPEHGIFGEIPYMERVDDFRLQPADIPVVSLYKDTADHLRPPPGLLESIDVLICDVQDVGSRYYTYVATMAMLMDACHGTSIRFIVLDRPNPIGLSVVEGNICGPDVRSFVSYIGLPSRHALTAAEIASYYRDCAGLDLDLELVPCDGLDREMTWCETGLPFVPPSPNIPDASTALVYTGMCLLEGTNMSEGRGTAFPFLFAGAPWITDPWQFADMLAAAHLPGVLFRPVRFTPRFDKHANVSCGGVHLVVSDPRRFNSLLTGMTIVATAATACPDQFALRTDAYEFIRDIPALDLLLGDRCSGEALLRGVPPRDILAGMESGLRDWNSAIAPHLLYTASHGGAR
ncbi:MAG TPA: DUF1343 domain-containing protein [Myxococcota bacterium]|nr:DUF1343 domain-containing protein [Myxococcota bacterium]HOD08937.1 DUF1343 domain-containing protein [Myxococcota bacterium]